MGSSMAQVVAPPVWNPTINNTLSWIQPTQNSDGSPVVPGELTANTVYRGTKSDGSDLVLAIVLTPAMTSYIDASIAAGKWCYAVSATGSFTVTGSGVVAKEGAKSNVLCVTKIAPPPPAPNPPTNPITVASAVYTIIQGQDRLVMLRVGTAPAGTACDPAQAVVGDGVPYYAVPVAKVSWSGNVRPSVVVSKCNS